jgi:hypothetical protein
MIIDLQRTVIKTQLRRFITLIVFVIIIIFILLTGDQRVTKFGLNKYHWAIVVAALYFGSSLIESVLNFNYIYYSDDGDLIILRYFSMSFFNNKKNLIQIPKEHFLGYKIFDAYNGYKKTLILYQDFNGKEAKYPAVNISALSREQRDTIFKSLDRYKFGKTIIN